MKSHVYFLKHRKLPYYKCGKADVVIARVRQIGIEYFDLKNSFAYEVDGIEDAMALERIFHLCNRKDRIKASAALPKDGATEWFSSGCLNNHQEILRFTNIATRKIEDIVIRPAPTKVQRYIKPKRRTPETTHYFDSPEEGLEYSVNLLSNWLKEAVIKYPNISIRYIEFGQIIIGGYKEYGGDAEDFGGDLFNYTNYSWRRFELNGARREQHSKFIESIQRTSMLNVQDLTIGLRWDGISDEQLNSPEIQLFKDRWEPHLRYQRNKSPQISHLVQQTDKQTPEWGWI